MVSDSKDQTQEALPEEGQPSEKVESTSTELWFKENEVLFLAEAHANKKHATLDKQIAEQGKYLGFGQMERERRIELEEKVKQFQEKEEKALGEAAKDDTDLFNVVQLRKEAAADRAALAAEKAKLSWSQIEHSEKLQRATELEWASGVREICDELGVSRDEVLSLNPQSLDEAKRYAENIAQIKSSKTPEPDTGITSGGGELSLDKATELYAKGKISTEKYLEAKEKK